MQSLQASASGFIRVEGSFSAVSDKYENTGALITLGFGGGTPSLSAGASITTIPNARTLYDLTGWGMDTGFSVGLFGADYVSTGKFGGNTGSLSTGKTPGLSIHGKLSPIPEVHAGTTYTWFIPDHVDNPIAEANRTYLRGGSIRRTY